MKLRVNLLTPELLPQQQRLDFKALLMVSGVVFGLGLLVLAFTHWQLGQLVAEKALLTIQKEQLQLQQKSLVEAKAARKVSPKLQRQLEEAQQELEIKLQLVQQVSQGLQPEEQAYSLLLENLARVNEPDVWLDGIGISGSAITLEGYTTQAELVPNWLRRMGQQGYIQGRSFGQLTITEAAPWHRFELRTPLSEEAQP